MAKTRSMNRKENHDASSNKRFKTCETGVTWSDLNHDLLFLVMMQLGVVDFLAFGGVCKSWRSLALSNRNKFLVSRPPMIIRIYRESNEKDYYLYLEDNKGRNFKTILPHSAGRTCVGFTCGFLVLFGRKTHDFWLVNPITRHELHFPDIPSLKNDNPNRIRALLVYSPSISGLVLVVLNTITWTILFSVAGTRTWNHVSSTFSLHDLYAFKGKIYVITHSALCEPILDPQAKLTLLETNDFSKSGHSLLNFLNQDENLYVIGCKLRYQYKLHDPDLGEVLPAMIAVRYDYHGSDLKYGFAIKPELWADPWSQYNG